MDKKEILDYFRNNLFEAYGAYNAWKVIAYSKYSGVVSQEQAEHYVKIQKYHPQFFLMAERSFLVNFVLFALHPFDRDDRSYSLYAYDRDKTEAFVAANKEVIDALFQARNKVFAHRDAGIDPKSITIPSLEKLDPFFTYLHEFYNELTREFDQSRTMFDNAEALKREIELLFMNLERGETVRLKEIDIKWLWEENNKKISDII